MQSLKEAYNKTLQRYYNGCNYLMEHPNEWDKYIAEVLKLLNVLNKLSTQIPATKEELLNGFEV